MSESKFGECYGPANVIFSVDMSLNYGFTEHFTLTQITFGILNAINLQLKQGEFYCVNTA